MTGAPACFLVQIYRIVRFSSFFKNSLVMPRDNWLEQVVTTNAAELFSSYEWTKKPTIIKIRDDFSMRSPKCPEI